MKRICFHLSMSKLDKWQNYNFSWTLQKTKDMRQLNNMKPLEGQPCSRRERDVWIGSSMAGRGRKRCQPPYSYPHRMKGMPVSRNQSYLPQPLLVPVRCLTFNKKLWNIQIRRIKSLSIDKKWPRCWKYIERT